MAEANPRYSIQTENGESILESSMKSITSRSLLGSSDYNMESITDRMLGRSRQVQKRSRNQVTIFLYGKSGSGKSSTLNYLFGTDICPVSNERSKTRNVTEYGCNIENTGWFGKGLNLSFIDTPGLGDTQERGKDPENLAKISSFIENHPELGLTRNRIYPNIVLVVVSATDNRMYGIDSEFSKMLHALINLNVVDRFCPNVVIVVTNAMHFTREQYVERSERNVKIYRLFARAHLSIDVPVVFIENKDERNEMKQEGDWKILPDGKRQPLNLFEVIKDLMRNSGDEMGVEAVRLVFDNSIKYDFKEVRHDLKKVYETSDYDNWKRILEEEFFSGKNNQIYCTLLSELNHDEKEEAFPLAYQLQKVNYVKISDLRNKNLAEIKRALHPFQPDEREIEWLHHLFKVSLMSSKLNFTLLGLGYSRKFKEKRKPILNLGPLNENNKNQRVGNYEISIPEHCVAKHPRKITIDITYNNNVYWFVKRRLEIHFRISYRLFQVDYEFFEGVPLKSEFISLLRKSFPKRDNHVSSSEPTSFPDFIKKYGLHCITGLYFGGYIEGDLYLDSLPDDDGNNKLLVNKIQVLLTLLNNYFNSLQNGTFQNQIHFPSDTEFSQKLLNCTLTCKGGNKMFQSKRISDITLNGWNNWINSIGEDIVCLDKILILTSIFKILLSSPDGEEFAHYFSSFDDLETDSESCEGPHDILTDLCISSNIPSIEEIPVPNRAEASANAKLLCRIF